MGEEVVIMAEGSTPATPSRGGGRTPPVSAPPSQLHSPSLSRSPLLITTATTTPTRGGGTTPRFLTPLASPMRRAAATMRGYLEEVGHLTKLDPQDAWLPITESRSGNALYAAFHTLSSGIGFQALVLPLAFTTIGWAWGIFCLTMAFGWQLYTLWLLVQLHESVPGVRHSRYLQLCQAAFGVKLGNLMALFPTMYLSAGTCTALVIVCGGSMKLFFQIIDCGGGSGCDGSNPPLTTVEWYLVFTLLAVVLSQLPNLNSIAGVSMVGAATAVAYCTIIWVVSVSKGRVPGVSYSSSRNSEAGEVVGVLNALGIIAFAFRGHNLVLEIQATMPSTLKHPSHVPMWRGVKYAYLLIALCIFPVAIAGFWAYGDKIPANGGVLSAMYEFHGRDTPEVVLGVTSLLVVVNGLSCFQLYAMPVFDGMESSYTARRNRPCPRWLRCGFRVVFAGVSFLIAVAFPFLSQVAGLVGGVALPVTVAYPCFMWLAVRKPERYSAMWNINWGLGTLGIVLSVLVIVGGVWGIVDSGLKLSFFKPQ